MNPGQTVKAVYRDGAFFPQGPCDVPENSEVELTVQGPWIVAPAVNEPEERSRILAEVTARMRKNPLPANAPGFSRDELRERG